MNQVLSVGDPKSLQNSLDNGDRLSCMMSNERVSVQGAINILDSIKPKAFEHPNSDKLGCEAHV